MGGNCVLDAINHKRAPKVHHPIDRLLFLVPQNPINLNSWPSSCLLLPVPEWLFVSLSVAVCGQAVAGVDLLVLQLQQAQLSPLQTFQVFG